jgi:hypothetical protein
MNGVVRSAALEAARGGDCDASAARITHASAGGHLDVTQESSRYGGDVLSS